VEVKDDTPGAKYEINFNGTVIDTMTSDRRGNVRTVFSAVGREVDLADFGESNKRQRGFLDKGYMVGLKTDFSFVTVVKL
jgi:hypothetical protein